MLHNVTVLINKSEQSDPALRWNDCREKVENKLTCSSGCLTSVPSATLVLLPGPGQVTSTICISVIRPVIHSLRPKNINHYIKVKYSCYLQLIYIVSGCFYFIWLQELISDILIDCQPKRQLILMTFCQSLEMK